MINYSPAKYQIQHISIQIFFHCVQTRFRQNQKTNSGLKGNKLCIYSDMQGFAIIFIV